MHTFGVSMLTKNCIACSASMVFLVVLGYNTAHADDMKPYPPAPADQVRMVLRVPAVDHESDRKVELVVGKVLAVDCNQHWFGGDLQRKVAKGWGFPYFVLEKTGGPASTMMACPEQDKRDQFVSVRGDGFLLRYNSKLPIVVYVPHGFEVRYRVWTAGAETGKARPE